MLLEKVGCKTRRVLYEVDEGDVLKRKIEHVALNAGSWQWSAKRWYGSPARRTRSSSAGARDHVYESEPNCKRSCFHFHPGKLPCTGDGKLQCQRLIPSVTNSPIHAERYLQGHVRSRCWLCLLQVKLASWFSADMFPPCIPSAHSAFFISLSKSSRDLVLFCISFYRQLIWTSTLSVYEKHGTMDNTNATKPATGSSVLDDPKYARYVRLQNPSMCLLCLEDFVAG